MKKYCSILLFVIYLLTGCSVERNLSLAEVKDFISEIKNSYPDINTCKIYGTGGSNGLKIEYTIKEEMSEVDKDGCIEVTQQWIYKEDVLEKIEKSLGNIRVVEIEIKFISPTVKESYQAYYYKMGPDGYQDNRYWTEENKDNFKTWFYSEY